jgi:hypothetical protein
MCMPIYTRGGAGSDLGGWIQVCTTAGREAYRGEVSSSRVTVTVSPLYDRALEGEGLTRYWGNRSPCLG